MIENAIDASKNDILIGNAWNNRLEGGAGDDQIFGDGQVYDQNNGFLGDPDGSGGFVDPQRAWTDAFGDNPKYAADLSGADTLIGGAGDKRIVFMRHGRERPKKIRVNTSMKMQTDAAFALTR